eukprot:TRINITY_DN4647_c1_g1_i1.p1 TRINITY_DN4647_c1_g1~~TRINITY_DN4647_c1_g1_i1.p1  ORF type:complete len:672 (+),score=125.89 TRINITY_DN4647_c1_g1_i1:206-2221(+)
MMLAKSSLQTPQKPQTPQRPHTPQKTRAHLNLKNKVRSLAAFSKLGIGGRSDQRAVKKAGRKKIGDEGYSDANEEGSDVEEDDEPTRIPPHKTMATGHLRRLYHQSRAFMQHEKIALPAVASAENVPVDEQRKLEMRRLFLAAGRSVRKSAADQMEDVRQKTDAFTTGIMAAKFKLAMEEFINQELGGMNENVFKCITRLYSELSKLRVSTFRSVINPVEQLIRMPGVKPKKPSPEVLELFQEIKAILKSGIDKGFKKERIVAMKKHAARVHQHIKQLMIELEYQRQFHRIVIGENVSEEEEEEDEDEDDSEEEAEDSLKKNRFLPALAKLRIIRALGMTKKNSEMDPVVPAASGESLPHTNAVMDIVDRVRLKLKGQVKNAASQEVKFAEATAPVQRRMTVKKHPRHSTARSTLSERASVALQRFTVELGEPLSAVPQGSRASVKDISPRAWQGRMSLAKGGTRATLRDQSLLASQEQMSLLAKGGPRATLRDQSLLASRERMSSASAGARATLREPSPLAVQAHTSSASERRIETLGERASLALQERKSLANGELTAALNPSSVVPLPRPSLSLQGPRAMSLTRSSLSSQGSRATLGGGSSALQPGSLLPFQGVQEEQTFRQAEEDDEEDKDKHGEESQSAALDRRPGQEWQNAIAEGPEKKDEEEEEE